MGTPSSSRRSSRRSSLQLPSATKGARRVLRDAAHVPRLRALRSASALAVPVLACLLCITLLSAIRGALRASSLATPLRVRAANGHAYAAEGGIADLKRLLTDMVGPPPEHGVGQQVPAAERRNVTVLAVNYAYRQLAMNFVCNLRRLRLDDSYVILAMDRAVYEYAALRGANVFYHSVHASRVAAKPDADVGGADDASVANVRVEGVASEDRDIPPGEAHEDDTSALKENDEGYNFGSADFVRLSRRKSMLVAEVLALGYDVFFSDSDVILYDNPHASFRQFAEDFLVMSDSHAHNRSSPLNYNINSGFYFVRARPRTFITMRAIVKYAVRSKRSEQKAFNHVLCGAFKDDVGGPGWRFGVDRCLYRIMGGVTTHVLPAIDFMNGSDEHIFNLAPSVVEDMFRSLVALHVNYVTGRNAKIARIKALGKWLYDESGDCEGSDCCKAEPDKEDTNLEPPSGDREKYVEGVQKSMTGARDGFGAPGEDQGESVAGIARKQQQVDMEAFLQLQLAMEERRQRERQMQLDAHGIPQAPG